jgi:hypothetical protein
MSARSESGIDIAQALSEAAVAGVFDSFVTNNMINTNNYT